MTETILSHPAWRLASWLPGVVLHWIFNATRMSSLVEVDVRARGDQLQFDCGDTPYVTLWLTVRNHAPFAVELDRARIDLWCGNRVGEMWFLDRVRIEPGTGEDLIVRGLAGAHYEQVLRQRGPDPRCSVQVRAHFESKVGRFTRDTR